MLRQIKQDDKLNLIPVVMVTSSYEERDLIEGYHLGVNAYLLKPIDFSQLTAAVKTLGLFWAVINQPLPDERVTTRL